MAWNNLRDYLRELEATSNCLMIYARGELIFQSKSRGIRPHLEAIDELGEKLHGTLMVDKIVGRAAALLILYSRASEVQAQVLSEPGKQVFDEHKLDYHYLDLVHHIKQEDGRIFCPFERMVQGISDPEEAYYAIVEKMATLSSS
jgi:hypothetical protein